MENRDDKLWKKAEARIGFKKHLNSYILVNLFLWALWYFTTAPYYGGVPWPIFVMIGWGIGIVTHYIRVYVRDDESAIENEYQKLKDKEKR